MPSSSRAIHPGKDLCAQDHVLSTKCRELQRDTFVFTAFSCHPIRLLFGLNQKLTPVSPARLHRWVDVMRGKHLEFFLCPVRVATLGVMTYSCVPIGPIVEPTSEEPLPPGNYAWYSDRHLTRPKFVRIAGVEPAMRMRSFEYNVTMMDDEILCSLYKFPLDIEQAVRKRDAQSCRVTGSSANVMLTWIVPPPWAWAAVDAGGPESFDSTPFVVAANALALRTDLKVHFYNHDFAVDADDDYRIVVFRAMGEAQALLPTHLPRRSHDDPADAKFFRLHLRYTLNFMLLDGDVSETYPPHMILNMMEQLGLLGYDEDREMVSLTDERWQTELGKAILANELKTQMELSLYKSEKLDNSEDPPILDLGSPPIYEWGFLDDLEPEAPWSFS
ncbi:hypothetical protein C8R43DRAFT_17635 [Mycena crocata]|nr:hypothetical protein C8R43DRAFT_17635 [Mycena crocata]